MGMDFRKTRQEPPVKPNVDAAIKEAMDANKTYLTVIHFKSGKDVFGRFNVPLGDELLGGDRVLRLYDVKDGGMIAFRTTDVEYVTQVIEQEIKED